MLDDCYKINMDIRSFPGYVIIADTNVSVSSSGIDKTSILYFLN